MGKEALEHLKTAADTEPAKAKGETKHESDKLGTLAKADSSFDQQYINRAIIAGTQSYTWFNEAAKGRLTKLRDHLHKEDEPDWFSTIASGLLEMAIGAVETIADEFAGIGLRIGKYLQTSPDCITALILRNGAFGWRDKNSWLDHGTLRQVRCFFWIGGDGLVGEQSRDKNRKAATQGVDQRPRRPSAPSFQRRFPAFHLFARLVSFGRHVHFPSCDGGRVGIGGSVAR